MTIAPFDTAGWVFLEGSRYSTLRQSESPLVKAVMRQYEEWCETMIEHLQSSPLMSDALRPLYVPGMIDQRTTMLWETLAVYLAYDESLLKIEELPIRVEDDGRLTESLGAPVIRVATEWRDGGLEAFADHLVDRLTRG